MLVIKVVIAGLCGYSSIELIKILLSMKINKLGNCKDYLYISGITSVLLYGTIKSCSNISDEYRKLSIS